MQECQVACENILRGSLHAEGGGHPGGRRQVIGWLVISAQNTVLCGRNVEEYFLSNVQKGWIIGGRRYSRLGGGNKGWRGWLTG